LKLGANYVDRHKTIQCDAEGGCLEWPHWECEGLSKSHIRRIDKYMCKACRDLKLGKTSYYFGAVIPQNDDETDDETDEEDVDEYFTESDVSNDSDGSKSDFDDTKSSSNNSDGSKSNSTDTKSSSNDSEPFSDSTESESDDPDDYEQPSSGGHKREAASQPAPRGRFQLTD
jgi:hypothetical protein